MKWKIEVFSLAVMSIVVLASFLGLAWAAKPVGDATVTYSVGWNPELIFTGGQVNVLMNNTGGIAIAKFVLTVDGGTVTHFYGQYWLLTVVGNTATWQAASPKDVVGKNSYNVFQFEWTGLYISGFTGTWTAYDKKGNLVDSGSFSWHYP